MKAPFRRNARLLHTSPRHFVQTQVRYVRWLGMERSQFIIVEFPNGARRTVHVRDVKEADQVDTVYETLRKSFDAMPISRLRLLASELPPEARGRPYQDAESVLTLPRELLVQMLTERRHAQVLKQREGYVDPNEALRRVLAHATAIRAVTDQVGDVPTDLQLTQLAADADALAEHVLALHQWLEKGGALPAAWKKK